MSSYIEASTLDDLMRKVFQGLEEGGSPISPGRGEALELTGVLLELTNPRARLSRSETRGKPFSCLGELAWYLSGSDEAAFIGYYLPDYHQEAVGETIPGAYGPRLRTWRGIDQLKNVIGILRRKQDTRQAVVQLLDLDDLSGGARNVPCTYALQFFNRAGVLDVVTFMRSNDAYKGLPHDIFCFTMIQEIVAKSVGLDLGTYKHTVGSLHLYDREPDRPAVELFLNEGWQPTEALMGPMPDGDPWPAIEVLLRSEAEFREYGDTDLAAFHEIDVYWSDLARMFEAFRRFRDKDSAALMRVRKQIASVSYHPFVDRKIEDLA